MANTSLVKQSEKFSSQAISQAAVDRINDILIGIARRVLTENRRIVDHDTTPSSHLFQQGHLPNQLPAASRPADHRPQGEV